MSSSEVSEGVRKTSGEGAGTGVRRRGVAVETKRWQAPDWFRRPDREEPATHGECSARSS